MADVYLNTNRGYQGSDVLLIRSAIYATGGSRAPHHRSVPVRDVPVTIRRRHHTRLAVYALVHHTISAATSSALSLTSSGSGIVRAASPGILELADRAAATITAATDSTATTVHSTDRLQVLDNPDDILVILLAAAAAS